jgi:hypothetical protein
LHVGEVEATWCAGGYMVFEREMTVAICIATGRCDVRWVEDVCIDELGLDAS